MRMMRSPECKGSNGFVHTTSKRALCPFCGNPGRRPRRATLQTLVVSYDQKI